jgi:hypothetical protein
MGKYVTVLVGLLLIALGVWGVRAAWPNLWVVLTALVPVLAMAIGAVAVLIGAAEIWDSLAARSDRSHPS